MPVSEGRAYCVVATSRAGDQRNVFVGAIPRKGYVTL
jgi:hypothetical protein